MNDEVARVTKVRPAGGRVLRVRFAGDRRDYKLDMTGLIARSAHFAPLMDDAQSFAKVGQVEASHANVTTRRAASTMSFSLGI